MSALIEQLAWAIAGAGIVTAGLVLLVFRRPLLAVQVMLDLFLAAGLLGLNADVTWGTIAVTAIVIALRQLLSHALLTRLRPAQPGQQPPPGRGWRGQWVALLRPAAAPAHWPARH